MLFVWENLETGRQSSLMSFSFDVQNYIKLEIKHRNILFR